MAKKLEDVLVEGEKPLAGARLHWAVFLFPAILIVLALIVSLAFSVIVGAAIIVVSLYPIINAYIRHETHTNCLY